jgi:hypothetical protein
MEFTLQTVKAIKGAPSSILWALVRSGQTLSAEYLCRITGYTDKPITSGLALLEDYQFISRVRGGWRLAEGVQLYLGVSLSLPGNDENRNYSDFILSSSSSNLLQLQRPLLVDSITTNTLSAESRNNSDFLDAVDDVPKIKRILAATWVLFGVPGVFQRGLRLETIRIDDLLGWLMAGINAENLSMRGRAGVVYNGLKSGERPDVCYQNLSYSDFPADFQVEIGEATKQCLRCHLEFSSLAAHDAHYSECIWVKVEEEETEEPLHDSHPLWDGVLRQLQGEMPHAQFDTWVRDTWVMEIDDAHIVIGCQNAYGRDWLISRLHSTCQRLVGERVLTFSAPSASDQVSK